MMTTASALFSHLWQSTVFALAAWVLTLLLRHNSASLRHRVWQAASVKFLIPFAWLVALGTRFAWPGAAHAPGIKLQYAVEVIAGAAPRSVFAGLDHLLPAVAAMWFGGAVMVLCVWFARWRKVSMAARNAAALPQGREVRALQSLLSDTRIERVELRVCQTTLEPGVFGIWQPVLLWPAGISDRLSDAQLEAILAHELRHVHRRDNLAAAVHMLVEAIFWFHPLVWWLGARLVEERERACDEDVLDRGSEPHVYAESILKVCQFCLASPLECMAGVAGSDLKKRMVAIMTKQDLRKLDWTRKMLLTTAGVTALAIPLAFGMVASGTVQSTAGASERPADGAVHAAPGVMAGMLVKKVQPQYPESARKAHIQGIVLLNAVISKEGDIENLQVVSGPPELAPAAIEAVKQWKYRPYVKDGVAVEVKTEITVNYSLAK